MNGTRKLDQLPSMATLVAEYHTSMTQDALHAWAHDMIGAVVAERSRHLMRDRYPNYSWVQIAELEGENAIDWKITLQSAVESLPLNNYATAHLPLPLPALYCQIQKISGIED